MVQLEFLVVENTAFDIIIGITTLKSLKALIDYDTDSVVILVYEREDLVSLHLDFHSA